MAIVIEQQPKYRTAAVGQELIYVVSEDTGVIESETRVKFVASVIFRVNSSQAPVVINGTFKATPNSQGVGIFDFSTILENYLKPDYNGVNTTINAGESIVSTYAGVDFDEFDAYHPIHLIDRYCIASDSIKFLSITFQIEYMGADSSLPNQASVDLSMIGIITNSTIFNGVLYETDPLVTSAGSPNYGYNLAGNNMVLTHTGGGLPTGFGNYLTNSPKSLDSRITDYGTLAFFNNMTSSLNDVSTGSPSTTPNTIKEIKFTLYSASAQLGQVVVLNRQITGGYSANGQDIGSNSYSTTRLLYIGAFPANLTGGYEADNATYADWNTHKANTVYYTVQAFGNDSNPIGSTYTINIIEGDCRFEHFRLCWLNKWGVWDYYTFTKKSIRSLTTNRTNYTQLGGTWNSKTYSRRGDRGGKKNFRVNTKEKITVNTDYISEDYNDMMEQLINSPEVYIINPYDSSVGFFPNTGNINRHVQPVVLTTSSFTRKTKGNDKLIQYTIEFERVTNRRTQRM